MERKSALVIDNVPSRRDKKKTKYRAKLQRFFYHSINTIASKYGPRSHRNNKEKNIGIAFFSHSQKLLAKERRCEKI